MDTDTMTVISDHAFNITERDPDLKMPAGVHVGGLITHEIRAGENIIPARLRGHWALKHHNVTEKSGKK